MQEVLISIAIFLTTSNKTTNGLNPKPKQSKSGFPKYSLFCQETFMAELLSHLILLTTLPTRSLARSYPPLGKETCLKNIEPVTGCFYFHEKKNFFSEIKNHQSTVLKFHEKKGTDSF